MLNFNKIYLYLIIILVFGCTAPRSMLHTGKVTPKGKFKVGGDFRGNIPTETVSTLYDSLKSEVNDIESNSGSYNETDGKSALDNVVKSLIIFSIDPIGQGIDFRARYGFYDNFDVGYKYDSGVHVIDTRYQFMGPVEGKSGKNEWWYDRYGPNWFGSIGVQLSKQDYDIPLPGLDKLQKLIGYEFVRYDLVVPLAFSYSLGKHEKYGALGFGFSYNLSQVKYGFDDSKVKALFQQAIRDTIEVPEGEKLIHSFGTFVNAKFGFKYAYLLISLAVYYQDYGKFEMFGSSASFSGFTFIPSIGVFGQF
jgi:hypothetical protein